MCTINKSEVFWENINVFSVTQTFTQCRDVSHWKGSYQAWSSAYRNGSYHISISKTDYKEI